MRVCYYNTNDKKITTRFLTFEFIIVVAMASSEILSDWGNFGTTSWEFWRSRTLTPEQQRLAAAVACVAFYDPTEPSIVLTRSKRGIELPGGHIDKGETIEQARDREAYEEAGYYVAEATLFGYRKYMNGESAPIGDGRMYPPVSYSPYYYTFTDRGLDKPTDEEHEVGVYTIPEIEDHTRSGAIKLAEFTIIKAGLTAAYQDMYYGPRS
jgi:8-oxo-dGTP pyrophosphatase MutT (NUDIX family)